VTIKNVVFLAGPALIAAGLSGCAAPLAMQGLSSSSPVAFSYSGRGTADSFWLARYGDVVQATLRAGQVLSLKLEKKEIKKDQTFFSLYRRHGRRIGCFD